MRRAIANTMAATALSLALSLSLTLALGLAAASLGSQPALAAGDARETKSVAWPHTSLFGTYDRAALQRGLEVYRQVCSNCHGLRYIAFRNLLDIGLSEEQAKAIAAEYVIVDGPDESGDMFEREGKLSDYFPSPFDNDNAARASNGGALPPDLSLIVKARAGHENYIYSLLTGYEDPPADMKMSSDTMSYNPYFAGAQIGMASPLTPDTVDLFDFLEEPETDEQRAAMADQLSKDVTQFLAWTSKPHLEVRKATGVKVVLFLLVLTVVLYLVKRKVWADVH